jgi:protoporphyrinogen oxidase
MDSSHVVVIGGGFTGLAAAYELTRQNLRVTLLEKQPQLGGLAASFSFPGGTVEQSYHHWFLSDRDAMGLAAECGGGQAVRHHATRTGFYWQGKVWPLGRPADLLRFAPLGLVDRLRLGLLPIQARMVRRWRDLEQLTADEWLQRSCGRRVYEVVWKPLLRAKFGQSAAEVSAVWMWNKLKLRGSSRTRAGREALAYYHGGFAAFIELLANRIRQQGGCIRTGCDVDGLLVERSTVMGVRAGNEHIRAAAVIATPALPIIASLVKPHVDSQYVDRLNAVRYLANATLVLLLDRSLSDYYWINIGDQDYPFVAVVEHTNFAPPDEYGGNRIVYLSRYAPVTDEFFSLSAEQALQRSLPGLKRLRPCFDESWVRDCRLFLAPYAQPVITRGYSHIVPDPTGPIRGLYLCTMAQVYPEDRGTNYSIRQGRQMARAVARDLARP